MYANLTGSNNTAIGMGAMGIGTTATSNTAIGLYALQHSNGSSNFGVGANAGQNVTTGANNFFLGNSAGNNVTTGSANFIMGPYNAVSATGSFEVNINNDIRGYSNGFYSASIGTGWGTGAVMTNWAGSFVFQITVGTTPSTPAVVNFPIAMPHGFACDATDTTTLSEVTSVVPTSTTSSTVNFFSRTAGTALAPTASDVVVIRCFGG